MQTSYQNQSAEALYPGQIAAGGNARNVISRTATGAVAQVSTLTIGAGATSVSAVSFTDEFGRSASISGAADNTSATTTAASLKALLEADPIVTATAVISQAAGVLTLTALRPGAAFTLSSSDGNVTAAASVAAASAPSVPFGCVVVAKLSSGNQVAGQCDLPRAASNTAQVTTGTPTAANSTYYAVAITLIDRPGQPVYTAGYTSDGSGTAAEIAAGLLAAVNTAMPAASVVASGTDTLILTAEIPGERFTVANIGPGVIAFAATTANVKAAPLGVALRILSLEYSSGVPTYPASGPVSIAQGDEVVVALCDAAASFGGGGLPVYYRQVASGSEQLGAVRQDVDGGDALLLPNWESASAHFDINIGGTTYRCVQLRKAQ
jgi:hypothetical protein